MTQQELTALESLLLSKGYRRFQQTYSKSSKWQFYKKHEEGKDEYGDSIHGYMSAVYVYDFREFFDRDPAFANHPFSISFECFIGTRYANNGRIDMNSSYVDDMDIDKWEVLCSKFYKLFKP